ncbi:T9SS type A sorting domain-containing protein [Reichenbachiella carrageenanivorans]|uniref:T9SS type A sorting domain-containing protein n=1 Tax=Reichenbachiella carrageenanivorans TaxID=2979869 RepID=A0ABY6CVA9_9BACT|nr:T9SS type A sorting domain-containing protein [Reichenbachiella carrageenanivorans]UXX77847.1 T9SS type A sorting domain-containing protein [Reichenbachiella carrageenanivorans]
MNVIRIISSILLLLCIEVTCHHSLAQVAVDVNLDIKHEVGGVFEFDRNKFVAIHANIGEQEWDGNNFTADLRDDFLNGYDVYLGRDTGGITWNLNANTTEDPARSGYANPADIQSNGTTIKNNYAIKTNWHGYEHRNDQILAAQLHPFWPDGQQTNKGWAFSEADTPTEPFGTATGEYMGRFIHDSYGTGGATGPNKPKYVEVINEPLWHLVDFGSDTPEKIFKFHNAVADEIRKYDSDILIGGFCTAFPDHEKRDFAQWNERWKLFMDLAGDKMDYWTIHLYDFPAIGGKQKYRKGSNMEATFDLMEQYSYMKFGTVKPFMVSEYGAQMHDYKGAWSPYRDWLHNKSVSAMMMQFMERANIINKTLNFLPVKAEWGTSGVDNTYDHRLLRKENEPTAYTGQWVYSDMVQIYQLWSEVNGDRVDSYSTDQDVMVDAYVDGDAAYVILTNLKFESVDIDLTLMGFSEDKFQSVEIKHLHLDDQAGVLEESTQNDLPASVSLDSEATMILKYIFTEDLTIDQSSEEIKYYATTYMKEIVENQAATFTIAGVTTTDKYGEAVLRLGVGRAHDKSLRPTVLFNNTKISIPINYRGDDQAQRDTFFGVLEIPVPYELIKESNEVSVSFADAGGHISSVAMQVFNFSRTVSRSIREEILSVDEKEAQTGLNFYPNPATDTIHLNFGAQWLGGHLIIRSLDGKEQQKRLISERSMTYDLSDLKAGIYFITISHQGELVTKKIVIE